MSKQQPKQRPVNLNLMTLKFPCTAIASILHRMSGVLLFVFIPFVLCLLSYSLSSEEHFNQLTHFFQQFWVKVLFVLFLLGLVYHLLAGIRHLLMDLGIGESLKGGRRGATIVMVLSLLIILLLGVALW